MRCSRCSRWSYRVVKVFENNCCRSQLVLSNRYFQSSVDFNFQWIHASLEMLLQLVELSRSQALSKVRSEWMNEWKTKYYWSVIHSTSIHSSRRLCQAKGSVPIPAIHWSQQHRQQSPDVIRQQWRRREEGILWSRKQQCESACDRAICF